MNPFDLRGKVALVTGVSGGLGEHFARTLGAAGATVVAGARRVDRLESLAAEIAAAGGKALATCSTPTSTAPFAWRKPRRVP